MLYTCTWPYYIPHCPLLGRSSPWLFQNANTCEAKYWRQSLSPTREYPGPNVRLIYFLYWDLNLVPLACTSITLPIDSTPRASRDVIYLTLPQRYSNRRKFFLLYWLRQSRIPLTGKFCGCLFSTVFCGYEKSAEIKIVNYS